MQCVSWWWRHEVHEGRRPLNANEAAGLMLESMVDLQNKKSPLKETIRAR